MININKNYFELLKFNIEMINDLCGKEIALANLYLAQSN